MARTIVEAVLQILRVHEEACILLCTPSNPAADTLVSRLRGVLGPSEMLRLNDRNRTFAEVPVGILQYCRMHFIPLLLSMIYSPLHQMLRVINFHSLDGRHCSNIRSLSLPALTPTFLYVPGVRTNSFLPSRGGSFQLYILIRVGVSDLTGLIWLLTR